MRILTLAMAALVFVSGASAAEFELSRQCPASFQKLPDGTCELVNLYALYNSPPQHGGVQAKIEPPKRRYSAQEMDLGRYLFFDPILSPDRTMSCATCHVPAQAFQDGLKRAEGRRELNRKTPTLWNVALGDKFMWDGRAKSLEEQALLPLTNSAEMGSTPQGIVKSLRSAPNYVKLFRQAFGRYPDIEGVKRALAAFENTLVSLNSRYDRYAYGDGSALNEREIRGYNAFRGFVARCSQCHVPPLFTNNELAVVGAPKDDRGYFDPGAGALTSNPNLVGALKVPTLRNVTLHAPYFSGGQFATLRDVVSFYNDTRGHAAPPERRLKIHWHVHMTAGPELSDRDVDDIVAFLGALEDQTLLPEVPSKLPSGLSIMVPPRKPQAHSH